MKIINVDMFKMNKNKINSLKGYAMATLFVTSVTACTSKTITNSMEEGMVVHGSYTEGGVKLTKSFSPKQYFVDNITIEDDLIEEITPNGAVYRNCGYLSIKSKNIRYINLPDTFDKLKSLRIQGSKLVSLPDIKLNKKFSDDNSVTIDLSQNYISLMEPMPKCYMQIIELNLSDNSIKDADGLLLAVKKSDSVLSFLNLDNNNIESVNLGIYPGKIHDQLPIVRLYLRSNKITQVQVGIKVDIGALEIIDLSYSRLDLEDSKRVIDEFKNSNHSEGKLSILMEGLIEKTSDINTTV
jgi:hypothetical protein